MTETRRLNIEKKYRSYIEKIQRRNLEGIHALDKKSDWDMGAYP